MGTAVSHRTRPVGLPTDAEILGRAGAENFTVASRLLPARARAHLLAFYGYARLVDQLGDAYPGDRLAALDWAHAELDDALADPAAPGIHPLIAAAAASVRQLGTEPAPLYRLIEANRQDQTTTRYATWDDLLRYCALSADPVGRLVLAAFGASTPTNEGWSDQICSGLQIVEHLQDVAEDATDGRIYLPQDDLGRFSVSTEDVVALAGSGGPAPAPVRALIAYEAARARRMLDGGTPLVRSLRGRARLAVAGFVAGGHAALDALAAAGYDPFGSTPKPSRSGVAHRLLVVVRSRR